MTTFFLFGEYSHDALTGIDAKRTKRAEEIIGGFGGKLLSVHALLGKPDIVMIAELPGVPEAMQASIMLTKATGIAFESKASVPVATFDRLAGEALS